MAVRIRRANSGDAEFLARVMFSASRSHLARGLWDLIIGADEAGCLDYLRRLAVAEPRSLYHYESFLLVEIAGESAAALCGFENHVDAWSIVADAMSNVPSPLGTAGSAHLQGIDFAGKTGSAQTVSNALKAKTANGKSKYKDNAWFVGVTPRRNPEIVVAVLFEGGEHGQFAARIAAQVVKAFVEKQRRQPTKVAQGNKKVEIGAVWNSDSPDGEDEDVLHGGRFVLDVPKTRLPLAVAAPGVQ